ncbi:hypothetical protein F2982_27660 (plasmid) [Rhizobium sp. BG4]|nr:hypothetical protein F2982_27660 [Rhizobium sp. BG4]
MLSRRCPPSMRHCSTRRSIGWRAAKATTMSRELRLSQVTGYPCLWEWQDERGETEGGPILGRFSKAFMIKIVAAFLQGWHVSRLD